MPEAHARHVEQVKYAWQDHDADEVSEAPPVQNTWYEVFDAEDVRLLLCLVRQENDETAVKDIEVRWTVDGTVYVRASTLNHATNYWIHRAEDPSTAANELVASTSRYNAGFYTDKRGLSFKVEVRITSPVGTNQTLVCRCVRETLEAT